MNFLAHFYLSGQNENIILGNFIADFVKGKSYLNFPEEVQKGILLHRQIDSYTDSHPVFRESKRKFLHLYNKYSGVFTDIVYDYFLASEWKAYSEIPLSQHANLLYLILIKKHQLLPERIRTFLPHLIFSNRLLKYTTLDGIMESVLIMEKRTKMPKVIIPAIEIIKENRHILHKEFSEFMISIRTDLQLPYRN